MPSISDETARQRVLRDLALLDTPPEREFDALAKVARRMLGTKTSLLTLIDTDRQWFKARCGLNLSQTPRGPSFCKIAVEADTPLIVNDAATDPRFSSNPFVTGEPFIRFYAGVPVHARVPGDDGAAVAIGSLCVIDDIPRQLSEDELEALKELACVAEALIEARATALRAAVLAEESRVAVQRLERERRLLKQAERMADIGAWRLALADQKLEWSDGVFAIHEVQPGSPLPLDTALDFYPANHRERITASIARTVETGEPFDIEADLFSTSGSRRRVRCMGELELSRGQPVALLGVMQDVTGRYRLEQALRHVARTDELTGIPNRAELNRVLDEQILIANRAMEQVAVLLIDLDGFKGVNDTLGHAAGDRVLCIVGERLRAPHLSGCFAARLGGDEFAVIVPAPAGRDQVMRLVDRLLADLRIAVEEGGVTASVTGTIGVAWSNGSTGDREEVLQHADKALYKAKRSRKGTAEVYGRPTHLRRLGAH
jgi:diguanylate cyclase (GGDEF)-like protein